MKKILTAGLLSSSLLFASTAQINVNNDTLEVGTDIYLNDHYQLDNATNYFLTLNHLNTESSDTEPSRRLTTVGLKVLNPYMDNNGLSFGLGIKAVMTTQISKDFMATPLSVYAKLELNQLIYCDLEASYSPRVLSFQDAETYKDVKFRANYKVLENGYIYLGYRDIETKYTGGKIKYDDNLFLGYEFRF